jgi:AcrR family transcriptional regulator
MPRTAAPPNRSDRRGEILAHAVDLVREGGFSGLTMKKVARRVGFTEAAAYRYFPTKGALILALVDRLRGTFLETVREIAAASGVSRNTRLERIVRAHTELVLRTDGLPIILLAEAASTGDRQLLARMRTGMDEYLSVLESLLPPPPRGTPSLHSQALLLFALPAVLAIRRRLGSSREAEREIPDKLLPFVVRSLTAQPSTRRPRRRGVAP